MCGYWRALQAEAARQEAKDELARAEAIHAAFLSSKALQLTDRGEAKADDARASAYTASFAGRDSVTPSPVPMRKPGMCACACLSRCHLFFECCFSTCVADVKPVTQSRVYVATPSSTGTAPSAAPVHTPVTAAAAARVGEKVKQFSLKAEAERRFKRQVCSALRTLVCLLLLLWVFF